MKSLPHIQLLTTDQIECEIAALSKSTRAGQSRLALLRREIKRRKKAEKDAYPAWICHDCGIKHGRRAIGLATWHIGTCGVCGRAEPVTEPRDFGHLKDGWRKGDSA